MYQVPFAEEIRHEAGIPTMTVGDIQGADQATRSSPRAAPTCACSRGRTWSTPTSCCTPPMRYGYDEQYWPPQYWPAKPRS